MPLRGSASCSAFDVSTRKVPSLALVPRGHLKHAVRAKRKEAGSLQPGARGVEHATQREEARGAHRTEDEIERSFYLPSLSPSPSPPRPTRRRTLSDTLEEEAEELQAVGSQKPNPLQIKEEEQEQEEEEELDGDDGQAELRLGERFLNMMALMARLSTQSLGDNPSRLARTNTERSLSLVRSSTERTLMSIAPASSPPSSPTRIQLPSPPKSPLKSPKHAVREVSKRLPRALQGSLTFDICMLLPAPMDERQSPLRSPIRWKRLRKRVRRRKLRRRARRTWQASHASWPPHASADYIVDHSRVDIAGVSAARLVERLGERKVNTQTLPRVISMPLPQVTKSPTEAASDIDAQERDSHDSEDELYDDEEREEDVEDDTQDEDAEMSTNSTRHFQRACSEQTPPPSSDFTEVAISSPQDEPDADHAPLQPKKRPLYHQPAWISPELHAWLVESGLFVTKPRHELLSSEF